MVTKADFKIIGTSAADQEKIEKPSLSFWQDAWRRLKQNKIAFISMWFLAALGVFTLVMIPIVTQKVANEFDTQEVGKYKLLPPKSGLPIPGWNGMHEGSDVYQSQGVADDKKFIFGTDTLGRSEGKRIIYGLRISLFVALVASLVDLLIGVTYGTISAWRGGRTDLIMQRILEILGSIPTIILVTIISLALNGGILAVLLALMMTGWIGMSRQIRNQVLSLKNQDYVLAARTLGESPFKIAFKHLIPNMASTIIVQLMMTIPGAIESEAVLSALNLGVRPPDASLGTLIQDAAGQLQYHPYLLILPALVLIIVSLAFYLFGDGLRDAFDPRSSTD
jgi:oligopeptide transport system permease protein